MNQQPDKFFRDKLESYQPSVPANAWNRIEAGLEKKTDSKKWWVRIAAALLLLATAAIILWPSNPNDSIAHTNESSAAEDSVQRHVIAPNADDHHTPPMIATRKSHGSAPLAKTEGLRSVAVPKEVVTEEVNRNNVATATNQNVTAQTNAASIQEPLQPSVENTTPAVAKKESSIKIVITADESSKYLKKNLEAEKNVVAQATSEEKKTSTLKKLLEKAEDLATNQDPLGDVRQMKDEILALNFKNEKRGQNK